MSDPQTYIMSDHVAALEYQLLASQDRYNACHAELVAIMRILHCIAETPAPSMEQTVVVRGVCELADRVRKADDRVRVLVAALSNFSWLKHGVDWNKGTHAEFHRKKTEKFLQNEFDAILNATPQQTANDNEVLECPFCGSTDISDGEVLIGKDDGTTSVQSQCLACGAFGPEASLEQGEIDFGDVKARAAWNRRVKAPHDESCIGSAKGPCNCSQSTPLPKE